MPPKDATSPGCVSYWKVYLDNFDSLHIVDSSLLENVDDFLGKDLLHPWQEAVRSAYDFHGTPRHPKKSLVSSSVGESQGAIISDHTSLVHPKP